MKTPICLLFFALWAATAAAQPNKRVAPALTEFLNTEFMLKFHDLKLEAESLSAGLAAGEAQLRPEDLVRIRTAYNQTAQRANKILESIKQDFLDPKSLKAIESMPQIYSDGLQLRMMELSEFYSAHFEQAVADAQGQQQLEGSPLLFAITELISLAKGLTSYFRQMQREARLYSEDYLNQHLIKPHRWRYWNELATGDASPDHYTDYIQYQSTPQNSMTPDMPTPNFDMMNNYILQWQQLKQNQAAQNPNYNYNYTDPNWNSSQNQTSPPATEPPIWTNPDPGMEPLPVDTLLTPSPDTLLLNKDPFKYPKTAEEGKKLPKSESPDNIPATKKTPAAPPKKTGANNGNE
ncbi:MAG: hypothetical protein IPN20_02650 [Haliscomenobacter sp.]|nr:hypothetical protein [Haliscomenobacter sp.]MBK8652830.1 hypothetical protein [Haliscomenobacter sp.]